MRDNRVQFNNGARIIKIWVESENIESTDDESVIPQGCATMSYGGTTAYRTRLINENKKELPLIEKERLEVKK